MSSTPFSIEGLTPPALAREFQGHGVSVAIVDSGVNFDHPHLLCAGRGCSVEWSEGSVEAREGGFHDLYGHGTCCAALVHALAPLASLVAVRVTADRATTDADRLAAGIEAAASMFGAQVIAVPMGTETRLRAGLDEVVARVSAEAVVVAAWPHAGVLPAECDGAWAAALRDGVDVVLDPADAGGSRVFAEGIARPAPGVRRNFFGPSLSTARVAAAIARFAERSGLRGKDLSRGFKSALLSG